MLSLQDKQIFLNKYHSLFLTYLAAIPVENAKAIYEMLEKGILEVHGGLAGIEGKDGHFILQTEHGAFTADHVFNATGPGYNPESNRPITRLLSHKYAKAPPCGGIWVDPETKNIANNKGFIEENLYAIGELTRGCFWAVTDMYMVNMQCKKTAAALATAIQEQQQRTLYPKNSQNMVQSLYNLVKGSNPPEVKAASNTGYVNSRKRTFNLININQCR